MNLRGFAPSPHGHRREYERINTGITYSNHGDQESTDRDRITVQT